MASWRTCVKKCCSHPDCSMFATLGGRCPKHREGTHCSFPRCRAPIWANAKCYDHSQTAATDGSESGSPPRTRSAGKTSSDPDSEVKEKQGAKHIGHGARTAEKKTTMARPPSSADECVDAKTSGRKRTTNKQDNEVAKSSGKAEHKAPLNLKAMRKQKRTATTQRNPRRSKRRCVDQQQQAVLSETDEVQRNTKSPGTDGVSTNEEMDVKLSKIKQDQPTHESMANVMPTNQDGKVKLTETEIKQNQSSPEPVTNATLTNDNEEAIELELASETDDEQQWLESETEAATRNDNEEAIELELVFETADGRQRTKSKTDAGWASDKEEGIELELMSEIDGEQPSPDMGVLELVSEADVDAEQPSAESGSGDASTNNQDEEVELELVSVMGVLIPISEVPDHLCDTLTDETCKNKDAVVPREEYEDLGRGKDSTHTVAITTETQGDLSDKSRCSYRRSTKPVPSQQKDTSLCNASGLNTFCSHTGCTKQAKVAGKYDTQGRRVFCCHPECTNRALSKGKCCKHGGGRKCCLGGCQLRSEGAGGKCKRHGGGTRCAHSKCNKHVKINGMCIAHSGARVCSHPRCSAG